MASSTTKRPWLVVLFAVLVTGGGHLYLRRWLRALGWIALASVATGVFVSNPPTISEMLAGDMPPFSELAPVLAIILLSWVDAYRLAVATTTDAQPTTASASDAENPSYDQCPSCGHEIDDELDFCQWCSEPLVTDAERSDGRP